MWNLIFPPPPQKKNTFLEIQIPWVQLMRRKKTLWTWTFRLVYIPVYGRLCQLLCHQLRHWNQQQNTPQSTIELVHVVTFATECIISTEHRSFNDIHQVAPIQHTFPLTDMSLPSSKRHLYQFSHFAELNVMINTQTDRETDRQTDRHQIVALLFSTRVGHQHNLTTITTEYCSGRSKGVGGALPRHAAGSL